MQLVRAVAALAVASVVAVGVVACEPDVAPPPGPVGGSTALYDPLASPPVVPTPNNLAFIGGDGVHLNVPDQPTDSAAQRAFNAYLRTLTGFPAASTATSSFSTPLDPTSATVQTAMAPGSIVIVDTTTGALVENATAQVSSDGTVLEIFDTARWTAGHTYAVMVFGGDDAAALRATNGGPVLASPTFFILRSPNALLQRCPDRTNPDCTCPAAAVADPTDTTCHSFIRGLSDAQARQAEPQRAQLDAALSQLLPTAAPNHARTNLVLFWTFSITTQPMAVFDPTSGAIPFPNDVLIDPMTGRVNLPIAPNDPQAALKMQLNTLDGFSTSAAITLPVDTVSGVTVDTASLTPGLSTILTNLDPTAGAEQPVFASVVVPGTVAMQPLTALVPDQRRYAVVYTRAVTAGGASLMPAPTTVLILQQDPIFDGTHSTVSQLSDAQAQQLEALRQALHPLLVQLAAHGLLPEQIAALWTFGTQSIERPLAALDAFPSLAMLPTDVTATIYTDFSALPAAVQPFVADVRAVVLGSFTTLLVYDPTTREVAFTRMPLPTMPATPAADVFVVKPPATPMTATVRFWLTIPKTSPGPGGARIVLAQHGLTSWRGDVFTFGEDFAKGGAAGVGFDIDFHGSRTRCANAAECMPASTTDDPTACILAAFSGDTMNDCKPAASGKDYIDTMNLFGSRSTGWQYVVDGAQMLRVLRATGGASLEQKLADGGINTALDPTRVSFFGTSLGSINGTLLLATDPTLVGAHTLNVGGGHLFEILADGAFHGPIDQYLAANGIMRGTPAYAQLLNTTRWIFDPIDPWSTARFIARAPSFSYITMMRNTAKLAIVQEAGLDQVIPPQYQAALSSQLWWPMGVDAAGHAQGKRADGTFVSTFFANATHGTVLTAMPSASMRVQGVTYVLTGGATLPGPQ
jgi:hypothetical protein